LFKAFLFELERGKDFRVRRSSAQFSGTVDEKDGTEGFREEEEGYA